MIHSASLACCRVRNICAPPIIMIDSHPDMKNQPLAEVFGFPAANGSRQAERYRTLKLCPYNNKVPNCTKDKANDPLGVCSIYHDKEAVITCPVRFRQDWIIAEDAAGFFFEEGTSWTSLTEVRLKDKAEKRRFDTRVVAMKNTHHAKMTELLIGQNLTWVGNMKQP